MLKLKPKMLRGVSFSVESEDKEISLDSLFPRGFKTRLIERLFEVLSEQIKTDDPKKFVRALFYFVYGDNIPKYASEKESDIVEFLRWSLKASAVEGSFQREKADKTFRSAKRKVSFSDILPLAYRGDEE